MPTMRKLRELRPEWKNILKEVLPGGRKWHRQGRDCRKDCPSYKSYCDATGYYDLCTTDWWRAEADEANLKVLKHVLDNFDYYNADDVKGVKRSSSIIRGMRSWANELVRSGPPTVLPRRPKKKDPPKYQEYARRIRQGQPEFRDFLLYLYDSRCAISRHGPDEVLEAAHIDPHAKSGSNRAENGLLLRADLHSLFDDWLIRIHPKRLTVKVASSLRSTPYWKFNGKRLLGRCDGTSPDRKKLERRWKARQKQEE